MENQSTSNKINSINKETKGQPSSNAIEESSSKFVKKQAISLADSSSEGNKKQPLSAKEPPSGANREQAISGNDSTSGVSREESISAKESPPEDKKKQEISVAESFSEDDKKATLSIKKASSHGDKNVTTSVTKTSLEGDKKTSSVKPSTDISNIPKTPSKPSKPVKPPKLEDKPFEEFIKKHFIPGLKSAIEDKGNNVEDIKLIEGKRPVVGGNCWMVFCQISDQRKFWLCFNSNSITSDKTILLAESNSEPSIVESFLIDEKKTTLPLLISRVLQRLNGQKWIGVN